MRLTSLAVFLIAFPSLLVSAQQAPEFPSTSGNAFVRTCSAIDKNAEEEAHIDIQHAVACSAYIDGFVSGISEEADYAHAMTDKEPPRPFCLPEESENGQLIRIALKFIRNHPEEAHRPTAFLLASALRDAFPCGAHTSKRQ